MIRRSTASTLDQGTPEAAALRAEDVSMVYPSPDGPGLHAIDTVSLDLDRGSLCTLLGPSGCGKSTFLMILGGLYRPTSGHVFIEDERVTRPWKDLGVVFQRDTLLEWRTVMDNIMLPIEVKKMPKATYNDRATRLLDLVGLAGFEDYYPGSLSGGMRQRVAICRSLVHNPRLLLMDEPFAAVDALTRERLNFDLLRLTSESSTTVVFVTHSIEEATVLSDQILVMSPRPGRVVRVIANHLPKPRSFETKSQESFHGTVDEIRSVFHSMGLV